MLEPGTHIGSYEVVALIGRGGMGEVYRAWDPKLGRLVALKVLSPTLAADPAALARFEREARAVAALSHPNILGIYDFGIEGATAFAVMELLDGRTLRDVLDAQGADGSSRGSTLSVRKALSYALQIAAALAAAHEKKIFHRDLKPENIFVTHDGRVKVLDFGLAQIASTAQEGVETDVTQLGVVRTEPGTVLGTVGYMSPEQVRGGATDHRSDIFSFGAVLYEMLGSRRAFRAETPAETMTAILKEDPPSLPSIAPGVSPGLDRIVQRCLEKDRDERFQSARDLAFALEALSGAWSADTSAAPSRKRRRSLVPIAIAAVMVFGIILGIRQWWPQSEPVAASFQRLSFGRGTLRAARFTSDGQSVVFGAAWNGQPLRLFLTRADGAGSTSLPLPEGLILSVSRKGELAISVGHQFESTWMGSGTLARAALLGGGVRELAQNVRAAEWLTDDERLAVVRRVDHRERLEWPLGNVIYESGGYISRPRLSPDGSAIAFLDHPVYGDNRGAVSVIDERGRKRTLTKEWPSIEGLAWGPGGRDIWFTASAAGEDHAIYATSPDGQLRVVYRAPATMVLHDVAADGRALLSQEQFRGEISVLAPGAAQERDMSLLDLSGARDISRDGSLVLITQFGAGSGGNYAVYAQRTDGSPAVKLGEGEATAISPDNSMALAIVHGPPSHLALLPLGAGEVRRLPPGGISFNNATWLPDGKAILACGTRGQDAPQCYTVKIDTGDVRAVTTTGVSLDRPFRPRVSPNGRLFVSAGADGRATLYAIDGTAPPRPIDGMKPGEAALEWTADGRELFVQEPAGVPRKIWRLDLERGTRTLWRELVPSDPAGVLPNLDVLLTPDGGAYAVVFYRYLSTLYLATGLR